MNLPQIHAEIENKDLDAVLRILESDPDKKDERTNAAETPLHFAAWANFPEAAKLLIDIEADVNAQGESDNTALIIAAKNGCVEIAKLLIKHKANLEARTDFGWTALLTAMIRGSDEALEVAKLLIRNGAYVDVTSAVLKGDIERVRFLIANEKDALECAIIRDGLLGFSIDRGFTEITKTLLENGIDPNVTDFRPNVIVAVEQAVQDADLSNLELLLHHGANPNVHNQDGESVFEIAERHPQRRGYVMGNDETIERIKDLLRRYGAKE